MSVLKRAFTAFLLLWVALLPSGASGTPADCAALERILNVYERSPNDFQSWIDRVTSRGKFKPGPSGIGKLASRVEEIKGLHNRALALLARREVGSRPAVQRYVDDLVRDFLSKDIIDPSSLREAIAHGERISVDVEGLVTHLQNQGLLGTPAGTPGFLPARYRTKDEMLALGVDWEDGMAPSRVAGKTAKGGGRPIPSDVQIGGDVFFNAPEVFPSAPGRVWFEVDIGLDNALPRSYPRPGTRMLYSSDGLIYMTTDHYTTPLEIGRWR